jgi:hypothetical protein
MKELRNAARHSHSALMKLRQRTDSLKTFVLLHSLPDLLLPALAYATSQKTTSRPSRSKTIVKYCGPAFLARTLGDSRARNLQARYAERREMLSGL